MDHIRISWFWFEESKKKLIKSEQHKNKGECEFGGHKAKSEQQQQQNNKNK